MTDLAYQRPTESWGLVVAPQIDALGRDHLALLQTPSADHVHRFRKTLRRLKVATQILDSGPKPQDWIEGELERCYRSLGRVRDLDVLCENLAKTQRFTLHATVDDLLMANLRQGRRKAMQKSVLRLSDARSGVFIAGLEHWLRARMADVDAFDLEMRLHSLLEHEDRRLRAKARAVEDRGRKAWHRIRRRVKSIRYGLELSPRLAARNEAYMTALCRLHLVLGELNDAHMGSRLIAKFLPDDGGVARGLRIADGEQLQLQLVDAWTAYRETQFSLI
jgi:CHAD domain-containing protein